MFFLFGTGSGGGISWTKRAGFSNQKVKLFLQKRNRNRWLWAKIKRMWASKEILNDGEGMVLNLEKEACCAERWRTGLGSAFCPPSGHNIENRLDSPTPNESKFPQKFFFGNLFYTKWLTGVLYWNEFPIVRGRKKSFFVMLFLNFLLGKLLKYFTGENFFIFFCKKKKDKHVTQIFKFTWRIGFIFR